MKKLSIIVFIFGVAMFNSNQSKAQHFYTSFGAGVSWNIPAFVNYSIHDNYFGYDVAHVRRFNRHGYTNYNVLLHRNGWFVEVRMDSYGHIYRTINHRWSYPLMSHNCAGHCAFHRTYYRTYYPKYHHHKKVVYVNSHHGHGKPHHKKNHDYYNNVRVEKKQHVRPSRNHREKVVRNNQQQRKSNTAIRKPSQPNRDVAARSSSRTSSMKSKRDYTSSRSSRGVTVRSSNDRGSKTSSSSARSSSKKTVAYKNPRGGSR